MSRSAVLGLVCLSLVTAACGGGDDDDRGAAGGGGQRRGGRIVVAAEQWPECLNPVTSCQNSSWLHWTTLGHVLPRAMEVDLRGNFVASPLLVETPTAANGGIRENPFTITFRIRPEAVWDDGSPITSADFEFSWQAYLRTTGTLSTEGWDKVDSVDTTNPKVAAVRFKEPYADWWDLWGGNQTYVLKKAAFPNKTDLKDEMTTSVPFSGSAFKLQSWSPQQAVLVANTRYWDQERRPLLEQVTMVPREDHSTEINSLLTGETFAAFPQLAPGITRRLTTRNVDFKIGFGVTYEGLWFNQSKAPLDEKPVREALAYAIDRQAILDTIIKPDAPEATVLNCAGWVPGVGRWCDNTDFADVRYDPARARQLLEGAGWRPGPDGIYAKGGRRLVIPFNTTSGNKGREDTQVLIKERAKAAGFDITIQNFPGGELFQNKLPKQDFTIAEYAQTASPDPSVATLYACEQIPTQRNNFSGQNFTGWCNREADGLIRQADQTIDVDRRLELTHRIGDLVRRDMVWLPLYQKPLYTAWRSDRLTGPVGDYTSSSYSGFSNMYDWALK